MTDYLIPPLVSEAEGSPHLYPDGTWDDAAIEDCVPASMQMLAIASGKSVPATHAETEALRYAAGYPAKGGTTVSRIAGAADKRYGVAVKVLTAWADVIAALKPGVGMIAAGNPFRTPLGSPFRRYYPNFNGMHCVLVLNLGVPGMKYLIDPRGSGTYRGEPVKDSEVAAFYGGDAAGLLPLAVAQETDMVTVTDSSPKLLSLAVGKPIFDLSGKVGLPATSIAIVDRPSPYGTTIGGVAFRVIWANYGGATQLSLVRVSDASLKDDPTTKTQADVDAAKAAGYAAAKAKASSAVQAI